jgi:hypothetical protein
MASDDTAIVRVIPGSKVLTAKMAVYLISEILDSTTRQRPAFSSRIRSHPATNLSISSQSSGVIRRAVLLSEVLRLVLD